MKIINSPVPVKKRFALTIEAEPSNTPAFVRMKAFLKAALRGYRLRCTECRELPQERKTQHDD